MKPDYPKVSGLIDSYREQMLDTFKKMIPIKAISPVSGGSGEGERADFLEKTLRSWHFDVERFEYTDSTGTKRPNLVSRLGDESKTIWFIGHMDTVSEGDRSLWKTDPFTLKVDGDRIYGRGTEDNGSGVVASMYALKALKAAGSGLKYNFGFALVADEELGSGFGMAKLVNEKPFRKGDMFMIPDWGTTSGSMIEIGEKGLLWIKVTVTGKQVHASTPDMGVNASRYAARFIDAADRMLHAKYDATNKLFRPNISTFEPTKHEKNVDSVNIVPGTDVSYIDCRILPDYKIDDIMGSMRKLAASPDFSKVKITLEEFVREDPAPITSPKSEVVTLLSSALKELRGINAETMGIGGGTVAAMARKKHMDAVAWGTKDDIAHQPNEFVRMSNVVADAKVFAYMVI